MWINQSIDPILIQVYPRKCWLLDLPHSNSIISSAKFVRILKQVKTLDCVLGFHWSTLEFSQTFASVFTQLWRHRKQVLFLKSIHMQK